MKRSIGIITLIILSFGLKSQVVLNSYAKVTRIAGNTMTVTNLTEPATYSFATAAYGNNILIMQMQDDVIGTNTTNIITFGSLATSASAGLWEEVAISSITRSGATATVVLSSALVNSYNTGNNSSLQIISFPLLSNGTYNTTSNISGTSWNGNVGGVVAFEVGNILNLNNNITADAIGFRGGSKSTNYWSGILTCTTDSYTTNNNRNGGKGEGIYKATSTAFNRGIAKIINGGGGGGEDVNGGGAGGGNWTAGGDGGPGINGTASGCSPSAGGQGGISLASIIPNNRIFMGGGGGGGQQNNSLSSDGANGGGIVVIKAAQLKTNGSCGSPLTISANGGTAADAGSSGIFSDGSGGGGAAGTIVLQIGAFSISASCQLSITANGGNGGNAKNGTTHAGGGAGGQGLVVFSAAQPTANVTTETNNGNPGCNNSSVPCNNSAGSASGTNGSGVLVSIGGFLPVEVINFDAKKQGDKKVKLSWTTASETNNDYFTIEKSADGVNFEELEKVPTQAPHGNSQQHLNYHTFDLSPYVGTTYYRLKQTDLNQITKTHKTISISIEKVNAIHLVAYPNPNQGQFTLEYGDVTNDEIKMNIFDQNGKLVFTQIYSHAIQNGVINVEAPKPLATGIYHCDLVTDGIAHKLKLIIQ